MRVSLNHNFGTKNYSYANRMNPMSTINHAGQPKVNFGDDLGEWARREAELWDEYVKGFPTEFVKVTDLICHGIGMGMVPYPISEYQSKMLENPCEPEKYLDGLIDYVAQYRIEFAKGQKDENASQGLAKTFVSLTDNNGYRDSIIWKLNKMFQMESSKELKNRMRGVDLHISDLRVEAIIIMIPYYEEYLKETGQLKEGISFKFIQDFYQFKHNVNNSTKFKLSNLERVAGDCDSVVDNKKAGISSLIPEVKARYLKDSKAFFQELSLKLARKEKKVIDK